MLLSFLHHGLSIYNHPLSSYLTFPLLLYRPSKCIAACVLLSLPCPLTSFLFLFLSPLFPFFSVFSMLPALFQSLSLSPPLPFQHITYHFHSFRGSVVTIVTNLRTWVRIPARIVGVSSSSCSSSLCPEIMDFYPLQFQGSCYVDESHGHAQN